MRSLADVVAGREIVVCAGAGGVGKTTVSAAVALGAAAQGRRVAVLTIDPARRLANALGLPELGDEERLIDRRRLARAGIEMRGELWASMLDPKHTFDEVVHRYAPDAATREAILGNRIYRELSSAVAGSQEYMAMERLHDLHAEGRYDLLVLDTPPTRNALDFLDAPERLARFIESRALQVFLASGRTGLRFLSRGTSLGLRLLERLTGAALLSDLSEFFMTLGGLAEGFRERAMQVRALLAGERSTFVLVCSTHRHAIDEAIFFRRRLAESGMPFGGAVVNRVDDLRAIGAAAAAVEAQAAPLLGEQLARKLARAWEDHRRVAERDRDSVARLRAELGERPLVAVPRFDDDVHDLEGLARMSAHLLGQSATPT